MIFSPQYVSNVPVWSPQCDDGAIAPNASGTNNPNEGLLETAIHQHQSLYELMCLNYTEVREILQSLHMFRLFYYHNVYYLGPFN